jgi:hypothetical protein
MFLSEWTRRPHGNDGRRKLALGPVAEGVQLYPDIVPGNSA